MAHRGNTRHELSERPTGATVAGASALTGGDLLMAPVGSGGWDYTTPVPFTR